MRVILDTVAFLWAMNSTERLSQAVLAILRDESAVVEVSSVSISEIAIKNAVRKLALGKQDVVKAVADLRVEVLPYSERHALRMFDLPLHHRDPFDRQIIAQGLAENVPIATPDPRFKMYEGLKIIW